MRERWCMKEGEVELTLSWRNDGGTGLALWWWYERKQKSVRTCWMLEDIPQKVSTSGISERWIIAFLPRSEVDLGADYCSTNVWILSKFCMTICRLQSDHLTVLLLNLRHSQSRWLPVWLRMTRAWPEHDLGTTCMTNVKFPFLLSVTWYISCLCNVVG